jgi:hypothetical protein
MVRAKFKVDKIERSLGSIPFNVEGKTDWKTGELRTVIMSPVYGKGDPDHENTKFWQATPTGSLQLTCANLAAVEQFELGKEYYIDFVPAD